LLSNPTCTATPRLLILCPTSELVVQVLGVVRQLSRGGLRSRSLCVTAGATRTQIDTLKVGLRIVV
jgi:superfamily II DNA/RNA helicase